MPLRSITLPAPIAFPRTGYDFLLAHHARLLVQHAPRLHAEALGRLDGGEELVQVDHYAGHVFSHEDGREDVVRFVHRPTSVAVWRGYRGIAARLLEQPPSFHLYVVVCTRRAVSLHTMHLDERRLEPVGAALVVEPFEQRHRVSGLAPLLVTRWVEPGGEARFAWVTIPSEPATPGEALHRLLVRYEAAAREEIAEALARGETHPVAWVRSDSQGDSLDVKPREVAFVLAASFPKVMEAVERWAPRGRVPVVGNIGSHARVRWLDLEATTPAADDPAEIVEGFEWPEELADLEDEDEGEAPDKDPVTWLDFSEMPPDDTPDVFRRILDDAPFDEIDMHLGTMSAEQLADAIADAGFDPVAERARGVGVREEVVRAIAERRPPTPAR